VIEAYDELLAEPDSSEIMDGLVGLQVGMRSCGTALSGTISARQSARSPAAGGSGRVDELDPSYLGDLAAGEGRGGSARCLYLAIPDVDVLLACLDSALT